MSRNLRLVLAALLAAVLLVIAGCKGEEEYAEPEAFSFIVYPGSRYLGQLTELAKKAHKLANPQGEPPPTAMYDTDATVEQVAEYYAKEYGYGTVAPEAPNNMSAAKPPAYYRAGDLATDVKAIEGLLKQLGVQADISKASGMYKACDIQPRPNRPRVIIQRPYFDSTTSQTVDRTLILMSRG